MMIKCQYTVYYIFCGVINSIELSVITVFLSNTFLWSQSFKYMSFFFYSYKCIETQAGSNLDAFDFMKIVDECLQKGTDNMLYIIVPSLAFLFKPLWLVVDSSTDPTETVARKVPVDSMLRDIYEEFSGFLNREDMDLLRSSYECDRIKECPVATELLLRQLLYHSLYMRNSLRAKTVNSEMIFYGIPIQLVNVNLIKHVLGDMVSIMFFF